MKNAVGRVRLWGNEVFVPDDAPRLTGRTLTLRAAATVLFTAIVVYRASTTLITTTVWAEDGRQFLADAVSKGSIRSLLVVYAGYTNLIGRLIGDLAAAAPPRDAAFVLASVSSVTVALLALFCAVASRSHIRNPLARGVLALACVALPIGGYEVLGNAAGVHWFFLVASFWALLWRPTSRAAVVLSCAIVAVSALSDPLTAVLVPLAAWRVVSVTGWRDRAVAIALTVGLGVEAIIILTSPQTTFARAFGSAARLFELRVVVGTLLGVRGTTHFWTRFGWHAVDALFVVAVVALGWLWWRAPRQQRVVSAAAAITAFVLYVGSTGLRWADGYAPGRGGGVVVVGGRYTVVPALLLVGAIAVLVDRNAIRVAQVAALLVVLSWSYDLRVSNPRSGSPSWADSLAAARSECDAGARQVRLPILPASPDDQWAVLVDCYYVRR